MKLSQSVDIVATCWTLARMCVESRVAYAEVGKIVRGAMRIEQKQHDVERAATRKLRRQANRLHATEGK